MLFIAGFLVVIGAVMGGYMGAGGHVEVLWQPLEFVIIFGAGIGAFLIAFPTTVVKGVLGNRGKLIKGAKYSSTSY